ncbi:mannosyl-oligosaccharide 1,2-alpha-mannosidase IB isoform X2 [Cephus cinctus]|uniref:Mannosyl-oligosaccharide 1,2-alpha-mannosidase IB isoform X2 n=1 Tax=Cephus cinctus TaxID=211228 RepID=A0AAJ7C2R5_CEPCN|nr:mannosyl-oligosaccharide 1,2-alpha-mannosidase IB isoform X2 [Cephus cinctus]
MTSTGILPTYQRFVNGVPVPLFSRRSFRPREKYLIFLVFLTFGIVCFGAFFFLPDFRNGTGGAAVNSVYRVYQYMQKAGPELLIPAPPHALGRKELGGHPNAIPVGLHRHGYAVTRYNHPNDDSQRLQAKINEEYQHQKTLEKPDIAGDSRVQMSSSSSLVVNARIEETLITVPPAPGEKLPKIVGGEDKDPITRQRRDKVKELTLVGLNTVVSIAAGSERSRGVEARFVSLDGKAKYSVHQ